MDVTMHPDTRRLEAACLAALVLLPVLLEGRALLPGRVLSPARLLEWYAPWRGRHPGPVPADPLLSDLGFVFHPWLLHARRELRAGRIPLWNPNAYAGTPFLANMQSGLLCPFNALAYVLPFGFAVGLAAVLKLEVAGLGAYGFLRLLGAGPPGALLGGTTFMFSGFVVVWLGWSLGSTGVWLPAVFAAVAWLRRSGSPRAIAGLAATVAVVVAGGHPETAAHVIGAAALWAAWQAGEAGSARRRFLGRAAAGAVLGVLAASVVVIPFLSWLPGTVAYAARRSATDMPVWPFRMIVNLFVPRFFGHPGSGTLWDRGFPGNYNEVSGAAGLVPWLLLPFAFLPHDGSRRMGLFFAVLGVACLPAVYLIPIATPMLARVPGLPMIAGTRLVLVLGFCLSMLGGLGADNLMRATEENRRRMVMPSALVTLALLAIVWWFFRSSRDAIMAGGALHYVRGEVARSLVALAAGGLWIRLVLRRERAGAGALGVLVAIQLATTLPFARDYYPVIDAADFFPPTPALEFLAREAGTGRVVLPVPNVADVYGLADPTGCDAMNAARITRLVTGGGDLGRYGNFPAVLRDPVNRTILDLLGVSWIVCPPGARSPTPGLGLAYDRPDARIWRNSRALPLAVLVSHVRICADDEALRLLEGGLMDPRREALAAADAAVGVSAEAETPRPGQPGTCRIERHGPGTLVARTSSASPGCLVFLESWDRGWVAYVDGARARVLRADYAFCGVLVPAGSHRVEFAYHPLAFTIGLILTAIALFVILALAACKAEPLE